MRLDLPGRIVVITGAETESLTGYMLKVHRGRAILLRAFREPEQAVEAVGLRE